MYCRKPWIFVVLIIAEGKGKLVLLLESAGLESRYFTSRFIYYSVTGAMMGCSNQHNVAIMDQVCTLTKA